MVRFKVRYVVGEVKPAQNGGRARFVGVHSGIIKEEILKVVMAQCGSFGAALLRPMQIKYWNPETLSLVIRVPRESASVLVDTLRIWDKIDSHSITWNQYHIGGTIRSCEKQMIQFDEKYVIGKLTED
eukprot:TRINITY_DN2750_c0_g1_i1.p2 TRINITY_DN2750_c0_g1~~TRINITY_DN2750_c0_g1_i1.p2  ORF type:complete len:139 (+),score=43.36 TRINITY_DN2750_c0_g1_i1:34-417(+)